MHSRNLGNLDTEKGMHTRPSWKILQVKIIMSNKPFNFISSKNETLSAESRETALRAENERLRKALEPFAKAASDYERQGEFFSDNVELVLRVSVFAAPEYHNSTAVQVGDLRRARSELEAGHE